ncbi:methylated-DNA--[protein]-cysteine S-methyltransferase [Methylococcus capsulatus]|uniref:methylated-DNA--[protein]-cysteine S-methyltransferase n=1 Tax=Methylococcus capsulatus TaxID=414 RepID=UPI001C532A82|nr:methylated-DNA--[protein]-cysteine S-methyltransferase [Methylococcus capsulatus]QXP90032.1 methylated-DNA--[protein]-cysteine S-methyltransferase [Methylococcus capsulatus]
MPDLGLTDAESLGHCLFDTGFGVCGIAWRAFEGKDEAPVVTLFLLPEATAAGTAAAMARRCGGSPTVPPPAIAEVIEKVRRHFRGDLQDFSRVRVEPDGAGPFARAVYSAARDVPAGQVRTYGELARALNRPAAARAVGQALGRNPVPLIIPCHRILGAGGKLGGFSAHGGVATKARMLRLEGVAV